jgi:hypothetical protein
VKGLGSYDPGTSVETSRVTVTLATQIPAERCSRVNLGYADPRSIDTEEWPDIAAEGAARRVPRAGELLFRLGEPPPLPSED